jgi:hypothetical protein
VAAVLKYDTVTGRVELERVLTDGAGTESLGAGSLDPGFTALAQYEVAGETRLLLYESGQGRVFSGTVQHTEGVLMFEQAEQGAWRRGITALSVLDVGGAPYAITHSQPTRVVELMALEPLESDHAIIR